VNSAIANESPNIIFYNAGTDIYEDDPLGALSITKEGIIARDEMIFQACRSHNIPIVMVLSGGYTKQSAEIIAESLYNLHDKQLISLN
jgi:histone deacetylase 11